MMNESNVEKLDAAIETNGKANVRRSSRSTKPKRSWNNSVGSDEEELEDSLFDDDNDYIAEGGDYSEEEFGASKKKKQIKSPKSRSKRKRTSVLKTNSKKVEAKTPKREGSRRSSRTTSIPSYCEESEDSEDLYELCDGQPKVSSKKKKVQPPKVIPSKPTPKSRNTRSKTPKKSTPAKSVKKYVPTVTPDLVKTNFSPGSRSSNRKRSQVVYAEESSGDDSEVYELCDGQPIKRDPVDRSSSDLVGSTLSKHQKSKIEKAATFSNVEDGKDNDDEIDEKVVLVDGQPVLKLKAISMLEKDNQFFMEKFLMDLTGEELSTPLCIWKLHGKLLEKFVQIEFSKTFESTLNCVDYEEDELKTLYLPIKAIVFGKTENKFLAEVVPDFPENDDMKTVIERRLKAHKKSQKKSDQKTQVNATPAKSSAKRTTKRLSSAEAKKQAPAKKTKPPKKRKLQDKSVPPRKRGKPRKLTSPSDADEFDELSAAFPFYLKVLLRESIHRSYLRSLTDESLKNLKVIDDMLSSLSASLLQGSELTEKLLDSLCVRPLFVEDGEAVDRVCEGLNDSEENLSADKLVTLKGRCYDRLTLVDTDDGDDLSQQFSLSEKVFLKCRSYHRLHHFKKSVFNKCIKKLDSVAKVDQNHVNDDGDTDAVKVKKTLDDIIHEVADDDRNGVIADDEIVKTTLDDVIKRVASADSNGIEEKEQNDDESASVKKTLEDIISRAEQKVAAECPEEGVRQILEEVMKSVEVEGDIDSIEMCLEDKTWVSEMFEDLKGAVTEAKQLVAT